MPAHVLAAVGAVALAVLVTSRTPQAEHAQTPELAVEKDTVNCAQSPYRKAIRGTVNANLEITVYGTVCVVTGRVRGNVIVRSTERRCATGARFVALSLEGGTIDGRVEAAGKRCVMVWLYDRAVVRGDIVYKAGGNLGFLGNRRGARVRGDVLLTKGHLWATGSSTTNRVDGDLACKGGHPAGLALLATRTNWDGAGRDENDQSVDVDGTTGGRYLGCRRTQ
jgi:hypothetical protein